MINPIKLEREARGLSRQQLAAMIGCSYHQITTLELGYAVRLPASIKPAMDAAGFNSEKLAKDYLEWRIKSAGQTEFGFKRQNSDLNLDAKASP